MLKQQLKHAIENFIAAIVIIVLAGALAKLEVWLQAQNYPGYFVFGVRTLAIFLFVVDGIVVCGTALIVAIKLLKRLL